MCINIQINSISELNANNSARFGKKENKCCPNVKVNSTITIPRAVYNSLLGMAMLAMAVGGPLTSCEKDEPVPDVQPIVVPVDTATQAPVQKEMIKMMNNLGIVVVTAPLKSASSCIQKGDVIEFEYRDTSIGNNYKFKINEEESDTSKMVNYGTAENYINGATDEVRKTVSKTDNGILVEDAAIYSSGKYETYKTTEYVANADKTVDEFRCFDGTKMKYFTIKPKSPTSLIKEGVGDGEQFALDGILLVQK